MLDWQIVDSEGESGASFEPDGESGRSLLALRLLLVLLIAVTGTFWLQRERAGQVREMEEDLRQLVLNEERARGAGRIEEIDRLLSPGVPRSWRMRYEMSFQGEPISIDPEGIEIEWTEGGALVSIQRAGSRHLRFYRVERGAWRRAPLPNALLGASHTEALPGNHLLKYREVDRPFAEAFMADLPALLKVIEQWQIEPTPRSLQIRTDENLTIPIWRQNELLVVASPSTYVGPVTAGATVTETLRLAIAERLLPDGEGWPRVELLRRSDRLYAAARDVQRRRWALTPEQLAADRRLWVSTLEGEWTSPFVAPWEPFGASARIVTDYIYEIFGSARLTRMLLNAHDDQTWNTLLLDELGVRTYHLDMEALAWASGDQERLAELVRRRPGVGVPNPPFESSLADSDRPMFLLGTAPDVPGQIEIDISDSALALQLDGGTRLPAQCATMLPSVSVDGEWLEVGQRLRATSLSGQGPVPRQAVIPARAAVGGSFYLEEATDPYQPANRAILVGEGPNAFDRHEPQPGIALFPDPSGRLLGGRLLARRTAPLCGLNWLYLLAPDLDVEVSWQVWQGQGESEQWLLAREERGDFLLLLRESPGADRARVLVLDPEHPGKARREVEVDWPEGGHLLGWSEPLRRLVFARMHDGGRVTMVSLDDPVEEVAHSLAGGAVAWQSILSSDGLSVYLVMAPSQSQRADRLIAVDLMGGEPRTIFELDSQRMFAGFPEMVVSRSGPEWVVAPVLDLKIDRYQLLQIPIDPAGGVRLVTSQPRDQLYTKLLACDDERLLIASYDEVAYARGIRDPSAVAGRVWEWHAERGERELYASQQGIVPVGCP